MSNAFAVLIRLVEPCIFSRHSASAGGHECLEYVPGAVLLGSVAGALYTSFSADDSFLAFHSGHVSFGDGMPLSPQSLLSWPAPKSWHVPKGHSIESGNPTHPLAVIDLAAQPPPNGQYEQVRSGFVSGGLEITLPSRHKVLKSSVDEVTGRAADAQLFAYEAISAPQSFVSIIRYDDQAAMIIDKIKVHFSDRYLRIGRSRSAEFGKVRVSLVNGAIQGPTCRPPTGKTLSVWALSDLALVDANNTPTLTPSAEQFGWSFGTVMWDRTFLRGHSYTPYNSHLKSPINDRVVIQAGSVITFEFASNQQAIEAYNATPTSIGLYTEAGLGRIVSGSVIVGASSLLAPEKSSPEQQVIPVLTRSANADSNPPDIVRWAIKRANSGSARTVARGSATAVIEEVISLYTAARRFSGTPPLLPVGPGPTQWNQVNEVLRIASLKSIGERRDFLNAALFGNAGVARRSDDKWGLHTGASDGDSFSAWLGAQLVQIDDGTLLKLHEVANMAAARLRANPTLRSEDGLRVP